MDSKSLEFVYLCYPELDSMSHEQLVEALVNELADLQMVSKHCSTIYDHCTFGRVSKPNTDPQVVIAIMDDLFDLKECN